MKNTDLISAFCCLLSALPLSAATITIDPNTTYQTIKGWESTTYSGQDHPSFLLYRDQLFDKAVNDLGINRVRLEVKAGAENTVDYYSQFKSGQITSAMWRCFRYSQINDNADPNTINPSGFFFTELDETIDQIVLPLRQQLANRGESLYINLTYVSFTGQITGAGCPTGLQYFHDSSPVEYGEFVLAVYQHMQTKYGFVPDAWETVLEPDNLTAWTATELGQAIAAAATRLQQNGFTPRFNAPSTTSGPAAKTWLNTLAAVPGVASVLSEATYHRYVNIDNTGLAQLATASQQYGIRPAMLEWIGATYLTLHDDLKYGQNSSWAQFVLGGINPTDDGGKYYMVNVSNPSAPTITMGGRTQFIRQYFKFIRAGAQRMGATTVDSNFDPLAFRNTNGGYVVVVSAKAGGSFSAGILPAGTYGIKYTTGNGIIATQYDVDHPDMVLASAGTLTTSIPAAGVLTIYAKNSSAPTNTAPTVNAGSDQTITLPASATLLASASDDGLPNPPVTLTNTWSKVSGPGTVSFGNANALSTTASFSQSGTYVLQLTASDSALSANDTLTVVVNPVPPPVNVSPTVNAGTDRTITLPASVTLAGSANDDGLPNPPATLTHSWSKVSGPGTVAFGNASALSTTASFSQPGTYVLQLNTSDNALSASDTLTVTVNPVAPPTNQPPAVNAGADQTITLPASVNLSGSATDDGLPNPPATLTTTWSKVSGPGTVSFGNSNALSTTASFSQSGTYVLRLTASDSALSANDPVTIVVNPVPTAVNQPPIVNAGTDQTLTLPAAATLSGAANDDGLPNPPATLTKSWSQVSGPGTVTFGNVNALSTTASFSQAGTYVLRLTASDSLLSASDTVTVTVNAITMPPLPPPPPPTPTTPALPDLDLGNLNNRTFRIDEEIVLNYAPPAGLAVSYAWDFSSSPSSAGSFQRAAGIGSRASAGTTTSPRFTPASQNLTPGRYVMTVTVIAGSQSTSASATITLASNNLDSIRVYPNPWRAAPDAGPVTFSQLVPGCRIKIFTVSAQFVRELSESDGRALWDLKNQSGNTVASGIYIYHIQCNGEEQSGKLALIR